MGLSSYVDREYDVECNGEVVRLRPMKVWVLAPKGRRGVVIGLFKCPSGKVVRKAIGKAEQ